jgi:hypothetical protein
MAGPNIALRIEPRRGGGPIRYLVLPPATPGGPQLCQLSFQAFFTNNEASAVPANGVRVTFSLRQNLPCAADAEGERR